VSFAYLARRLSETPEPTGEGSMLDHTLLVWTNELAKATPTPSITFRV